MSTEQQLRERIAELEAQLEAVGAGGVQPLAPQQPAHGLVPLADVLARVDACAGPGSAVRLALEREFGAAP